MTSRKQDDDGKNSQDATDDPQIRLIGIADHLKWEAKYKPVLDVAEEKRRKAFNDAEAERWAVAVDAIFREYQSRRKRGWSKGEAGDVLVHAWNRGCRYTLADLYLVLRTIGWTADPAREAAASKRRMAGCYD
jgi:hypothetical protein